MDVLVDDLGSAQEVIKLFGKQLRAAREKIIHLEQRLASSGRQEDQSLTSEVKELANPTTDKDAQISLLSAQLRLKDEAEQKNLATIMELRDALAARTREYEECKESGRLLQEAHDEQEARFKQTRADQTSIPGATISQLTDLIAAMPGMAGSKRPPTIHLKRCFTDAPDALLDYMSKTWPSNKAFFIQGPVWFGQHAWVAGPLHRSKGQVETQKWHKDEWTADSRFIKMHGGTHEVFFQNKTGNTFYSGTYKAVQLPNLRADEFAELPKLSRQAILRIVADQSGRPPSIIGQLYQQGIIGVECLGLQFVGFDHALYDALTLADVTLSPVVSPRKRSASESLSLDPGVDQHHKRKKADGPAEGHEVWCTDKGAALDLPVPSGSTSVKEDLGSDEPDVAMAEAEPESQESDSQASEREYDGIW